MAVQTPIILSDRAVGQLAQAIQTIKIESTSLDWPAWVQAIGSALAILVAVWIAHNEQRHRQRDKTKEAAELVETIAQHWEDAMGDISYIVDNTGAHIENGNGAEVIEKVLQHDRETLRRICPRITKLAELPLTSWPDVGMGLDFYAFQSGLLGSMKSLERALSADPVRYPAAFLTLAEGFLSSIRAVASDSDIALAVYRARVDEYRQASNEMGAETRLVRAERLTEEARLRDTAMSIEADTERRANERAELIRSYPKEGERTPEQTNMLESMLALRRLDPLKPLTAEEQAEEERFEAEHEANMERSDKAYRARLEERDRRSREYDREYGDNA